ncbi:hypothetical protein BK653_02745 [Pseudomonas brassicacearum]|nr:hypothetical protein BK653_02745 [Pseudomonas brassicacearum]
MIKKILGLDWTDTVLTWRYETVDACPLFRGNANRQKILPTRGLDASCTNTYGLTDLIMTMLIIISATKNRFSIPKQSSAEPED